MRKNRVKINFFQRLVFKLAYKMLSNDLDKLDIKNELEIGSKSFAWFCQRNDLQLTLLSLLDLSMASFIKNEDKVEED